MALIKCPECKKEVSDKALSCPNCGCPIATEQKPALTSMLWDSEQDGFILTKCPSCAKISRIKQSATIKTSTGYKLNGKGKCSCGLVFDEIYRDERARCPECSSTEFTIQKEGFDAKTACCSAFLVGPLGILCGARKSNRLNGICLKCGHKWVIQKDIRTQDTNDILSTDIDGRKILKIVGWVFVALLAIGFLSGLIETFSK